jgi:predicted nuclease of predicted toxin-antitoxin system
MKLLVDMSLSPLWVETLRAAGWEAAHWNALGDPRAADEQIMSFARQQGWTVFTNDVEVNSELEQAILRGKDFVQIKTGPFDVDLVFAPDGIADFKGAAERSLVVEGFRIANLRDVIASKRASGRERDLLDLPLLERFREEYERVHPAPLRSAADVAARRKSPH